LRLWNARSQIAAEVTPIETATTTLKAEILRTILQDLEGLREEQKMDRELMQTELRRLEKDIFQLSRFENILVARDETRAFGVSSGL